MPAQCHNPQQTGVLSEHSSVRLSALLEKPALGFCGSHKTTTLISLCPSCFRNTDMWTTSCLKTTPSQIAFWTFGGKRAARGWDTCTAGTRSTKTSLWVSEPRWLPSTSPHRWESQPTRPPPLQDEGKLFLCVTKPLYGLQTANQNSLELLEDPKAAAVDEIAAKLGLCKVELFPSVILRFSCLLNSSRL